MILSAHTARQLRNASLSALYRVAYDHDVDLADVMASITPSQPSPASQAPAARTPPVPVAVQAEGVPVASSAEPSPEPQPTSTPAVQVQDPLGLTQPIDVHSTSPLGAEGTVDPAQITESGKSVEPSGSAAPVKAAKVTNRQRVRECHEAHPDWTAAQIAAELGMGTQQVRVVASHISLTLPKSPGKQQGLVEPAAAPTPRPVPKQPPAVIPAEPFDADEPAPVVRRVMKAPTGRFYLRDKVTGHYVHQSLQPSPTGKGPMMTSDRKWGWFDTMERFKGAKNKWAELAEMRKEAAAS